MLRNAIVKSRATRICQRLVYDSQSHVIIGRNRPLLRGRSVVQRQADRCKSSTGFWGSVFGTSDDDMSRQHRERRLLKFEPQEIYDVVASVDQYKEFVPWCVSSRIISQEPDGTRMEAELAVGFQMFVERYVSVVTLEPGRRVEAVARDTQLFSTLVNEWRLEPGPQPGTCWLDFRVDFSFRSPLYTGAADMFFDEVVRRMVAAFESRARWIRQQRGRGQSGGQDDTAVREQESSGASRPEKQKRADSDGNGGVVKDTGDRGPMGARKERAEGKQAAAGSGRRSSGSIDTRQDGTQGAGFGIGAQDGIQGAEFGIGAHDDAQDRDETTQRAGTQSRTVERLQPPRLKHQHGQGHGTAGQRQPADTPDHGPRIRLKPRGVRGSRPPPLPPVGGLW